MSTNTCTWLSNAKGKQNPRTSEDPLLAVPSLSWLYQRKSESKSIIWFFLGKQSAGQTPLYDCEGTATVAETHNPRLLRLLEPASRLRLNSALSTSGTCLFTSTQCMTCITTSRRLSLDVAPLLHIFVSVWTSMHGCKQYMAIVAAKCPCESCSRLPSTYLVIAKA